jgi:excisionase family DNA binding protein
VPSRGRKGRFSLPDRLLKIEEARARLRVSRERLYEYLRAGQLPSVSLGPRSRRIRETDLDEFIRCLPGDLPDSGRAAS